MDPIVLFIAERLSSQPSVGGGCDPSEAAESGVRFSQHQLLLLRSRRLGDPSSSSSWKWTSSIIKVGVRLWSQAVFLAIKMRIMLIKTL